MFEPRTPVTAEPTGGPVIIPLSKPIIGHAGPITTITLREPTFGDYIECGDFETMTFVRNESDDVVEVKPETKPAAVARWFAQLSGLPMSVLTQLSYYDGKVVFGRLSRLMQTTGLGNGSNGPAS